MRLRILKDRIGMLFGAPTLVLIFEEKLYEDLGAGKSSYEVPYRMLKRGSRKAMVSCNFLRFGKP